MGRTKTGKPPLEYVSIRINLALLDALKIAAAADDRTLSAYIRRVLAQSVESQNQNKDK